MKSKIYKIMETKYNIVMSASSEMLNIKCNVSKCLPSFFFTECLYPCTVSIMIVHVMCIIIPKKRNTL